jgi:hypothetical protein
VIRRRAAPARAGGTTVLDARALRADAGPAGYPIGLHAFAKVNLSLRVGAVRDDGFHEVETILQTIDLSDTV